MFRLLRSVSHLLQNFWKLLREDGLQAALRRSVSFGSGLLKRRLLMLFELVLIPFSALLSKRDDIWVFSSSYGFSENAKYLFLYAEHRIPDVEAVWVSPDREMVTRLRREGYSAYYLWSLSGVLIQLRSKYAFPSHFDSDHWGAFYFGSVRTWVRHGHHIVGNRLYNSSPLRSRIKPLKLNVDYVLLPGSKKPCELYERTQPLWYQQSTPLTEGFPKNDALFERIEGESIGCDADLIEDVEHRSATETVVIYAPTNLKDEPNPLVDSDSNLQRVNSFLDETDAHLYIKLHPKNYQRSLDINVELSNITILANSMDLYPFLRSCDIFISDYTTSILDIHLLDIPVIYFPYDLQEKGPNGAFDEYGYTRRGSLAIDYSELHGGYTVEDTDELIDAVRLYLDDPSEFSEQRDRVRDMYFDYPDGNSSDRVCEFFLSHSDD